MASGGVLDHLNGPLDQPTWIQNVHHAALNRPPLYNQFP